MKKLGLLIAGVFFLTACDGNSTGNKGILPLEHDGIMEQADDTAEVQQQVEATEDVAVPEVEETTEEPFEE
ncbi:MAG: hypothetical protein WDA08_10355 [Weeksellaceae bacterium]